MMIHNIDIGTSFNQYPDTRDTTIIRSIINRSRSSLTRKINDGSSFTTTTTMVVVVQQDQKTLVVAPIRGNVDRCSSLMVRFVNLCSRMRSSLIVVVVSCLMVLIVSCALALAARNKADSPFWFGWSTSCCCCRSRSSSLSSLLLLLSR